MKDLSNITAAILAGGLGTRLRSMIGDQQKVLAEVCGRPFLAYLLDQVAAGGLQYVVLCTGHRGEEVRAMFGDTYRGLHLVYSQEAEPLGTAGALRLASPLFQSDTVLVMNGDSYCSVDLSAFWSWHLARNANATILLTEVPNTNRYGRVNVDANSRLTQFAEKNDNGTPGWINAGVYLIHHQLLLSIPANRPVSLEQEMLSAWIGQRLYGYLSKGLFLDIGTPEAYASAEHFFAGRTEA
ncbi:MAG: nucleotidyltransferase family protein [Thermodesulfobacteriota bacterium]|nr:nucleotidyltransferase family protein [Thermodesulfobacteriota bacterium]